MCPEKFNGQDEWQKSYLDKARKIVQQSKEDYGQMIKMSNIVSAKLCEVGNHQTEKKLFFCNQCKRSFCEDHGSSKKMICNSCQEMSLGLD